MLSFKIVIEINFDPFSQTFYKGGGKLITGFLHHLPFRNDDIKTLQNPCKKHYFSFTSQGMQQYISTIGTTGMPMLKAAPLFRLLNKGSTPLVQQIEASYNTPYINTHFYGISKQTGLAQWIPLGPPHLRTFLTLTADLGYINKMRTDFTLLMHRLSIRFNLYLNAVQNQL